MLRLRNWQGAAVVLACWGLLVPQTPALADAPQTASAASSSKTAARKAADVALTKDGLLVGAAYTPQGQELDGATVIVTQGEKEIVRTNTDHTGAFAIARMKNGSYQIAVGDKAAPIRVWDADSAPPKARQKAVLVVGEVVRGQDEYYEYCPDGNCPPAGGGPLLGLDVITLVTVGAATTAAVVTIINLNKLNDLEDKVDNIASP